MFGYVMSDYDKKVYAEQLADFLPDKMIDAHAHIWKKEFDPVTAGRGRRVCQRHDCSC